jgi:SAM-dependent methyltransferase
MAEGYALKLSDEELRRYAAMAEYARQSEADLWAAAGIVAGARVADVGCGPGALFPALVESVGPAGAVTGIDGDLAAVSAAQALVAANGWDNVTVALGKADDTGLGAASADVAMMRHVLAHNGTREQAIVQHLADIVRPGGHVYLVDIDGAALRIRPSGPDIDAMGEAYQRFHAARGNDLQPGLRLDELLRNAGLDVVVYRGWYNIATLPAQARPPSWAAREAMRAEGFATDDDIARWDAALTRVSTQQPTIFAPLFGAVGRRPS